MATLTVIIKYVKTLRSSFKSHYTRFSLFALVTLFVLSQSGALLPVSAQSPALFSTSQAVMAADPPGGTNPVAVQVPAALASSPFNVPHTLNIPPGFTISVYARINNARFMAVTPDGNLLVSQPGLGSIALVKPNPTVGGDPLVTNFVGGLASPHDMVFKPIDATNSYLYVSESNKIDRYTYTNGATTPANRVQLITGLPDGTSLGSGYNHPLKNIAVGPDGKIYVSIGSRSNADPSAGSGDPQDGSTDPTRASIYQYNADGSGKTLFAHGLRNAEGLAFIPGTNTLWAAVNNRDEILCPPNIPQPVDGCTTANAGTKVTSYVNNHPPEEFTQVNSGGNYGWPFCNPNPDTGLDNMPFDRDYQNNQTGTALDCANAATRISKGILAHSAPLGLTFLQSTAFPAIYQNGAVIGLHGSWDSSESHGYKVIYFPWNTTTQLPGNQIDFVTGWLTGNNQYWGRPVDMAVGLDGSMYISDDYSGTVYRLAPYLHVTTNAAGNSTGTVANILAKARFGDKVVFDDSVGTAPVTLPVSTNLGTVWKGVTIDGGSCSGGPRITLSRSSAPGDGMTLNGGISLMNIGIKGFLGKQLIINYTGGANKFGPCVVIKKN